jgi:hypothetical protein
VCYVFTGCHLVTDSNAEASSALVFTSLLACDCVATHSLLQPTIPQAGDHVTQPPTLLTAVSRLSRNRSWSSLYGLGTVRTENTSPNSSIVVSLSCHTDRVENTASHSFIIACYESVVYQQACLQSRSLAAAVSAAFTVLALNRYATIWISLGVNSIFTFCSHCVSRSQWPRCLRHEPLFAPSNTGIVGSNPTQGMDVCVRLFFVCVVLCVGSGLATGWHLVQGVLPTVYRIKKLKNRPGSNERTVECHR